MNQHNFLTIQDFNCIGNLAKHCDPNKLCIAIEEAKNFDIIPLFCFDFFNDILENWQSEEYSTLINGGAFETCNKKTDYNHGIKRVWVYFAYARYLMINRLNDTSNGMVSKTNEFSIPTPLTEITDFANKYRAMGVEAYKSAKNYLCRNRQKFPKFNAKDCENCNCNHCTGGRTKKLTGFRYTTIRK